MTVDDHRPGDGEREPEERVAGSGSSRHGKRNLNASVIARSDETVMVDGNHDVPPGSVASEFLPRATDAAWCHPAPKEKAAHVEDHVASYPAITVIADRPATVPAPADLRGPVARAR